ncbi:DeoR/GlpR family DNA-binding transcription regulator [Paenibacillus sp. Soil724D2]|uniref:DeoR/GlpR family DNA-binding transcription regulator n=1 Tax=Paenibacillus sp. (strain Soil724D2) TaxID=1736392 RepID=UPI000714DE99|nr:DeoR/GlpR family DNA-binding transcription regulator [Paenibacillus sp. Soil724D2]KRE49815.1 DeoR family transcriptional regulator [Paenibacillus sp. Soil724D2]
MMYQEERLLKILDYINEHHAMSVMDICSLLDVSRDTARRDIVKLVQEGVVIRTHGGVALPQLKKEIATYQERLIDETDSKRKIGKIAAKLIQDRETVILDVSTTVQSVAEQISANNITAITHSIDIVGILSGREDLQVYVLGGYLHTKNRLLYGPSVIDKLRELRADKAFIGATAIQTDGLYFPYEDDVSVKKEMARRSDQVIVVADFTKFTSKSVYRLDFDFVDILVTDQEVPNEIREVLHNKNIAIIQCEEKDKYEEDIKDES